MKTLIRTTILVIAVFASGCGNVGSGSGAIMQADPIDPAGSASIGTGSVTSGSTIPAEAKAAGIGLGP